MEEIKIGREETP